MTSCQIPQTLGVFLVAVLALSVIGLRPTTAKYASVFLSIMLVLGVLLFFSSSNNNNNVTEPFITNVMHHKAFFNDEAVNNDSIYNVPCEVNRDPHCYLLSSVRPGKPEVANLEPIEANTPSGPLLPRYPKRMSGPTTQELKNVKELQHFVMDSDEQNS